MSDQYLPEKIDRLAERIETVERQMRGRATGDNINRGRVQDLIKRVAALERQQKVNTLRVDYIARDVGELEARQQDEAGEWADATRDQPDYHGLEEYNRGRRERAREIVKRLRDVNDEGPWMFTDQDIRDDMADWIEREFGAEEE